MIGKMAEQTIGLGIVAALLGATLGGGLDASKVKALTDNATHIAIERKLIGQPEAPKGPLLLEIGQDNGTADRQYYVASAQVDNRTPLCDYYTALGCKTTTANSEEVISEESNQ